MCHVLIIEDEMLIALDLQCQLEALGATSFSFADTQTEAIDAARERRPDFITSDVALLEGTGPRAVETILRELGPVPVIFVTGTPQDCKPCAPPGRVLSKPLHSAAFAAAFRDLAPNVTAKPV
ncbi:response regulator [Sphingomonas sp. PAMC 26605]|uniref:response regulator n=1 Tax=Sphingomonas sp. PAMC 26605 TaxID=1112214 RepID=UPI00026CACEA|nr:response regulator [Sphingomonas sp. PAMC 26605]